MIVNFRLKGCGNTKKVVFISANSFPAFYCGIRIPSCSRDRRVTFFFPLWLNVFLSSTLTKYTFSSRVEMPALSSSIDLCGLSNELLMATFAKVSYRTSSCSWNYTSLCSRAARDGGFQSRDEMPPPQKMSRRARD